MRKSLLAWAVAVELHAGLIGLCLAAAPVGRAALPAAVAAVPVSATVASPWAGLVWAKAAPSPFPRVESPTAVVDGKLYVFSGFVPGLGVSNELDTYDPATNTWKRLKDMPTQITHVNAARDGEVIWFAGGFKGKHPGPVTDEVWKYDIAADTWTAGPPLPQRRGGGGLAVVDGKLHYFGGFKPDRNTTSGDHWSLSLAEAKTWRTEPPMPNPRGHVAAAALDGKIYALGGTNGHDVTQVDQKSCDCFDPAAGKWTKIADLPDARSHFEGSTLIHKGRIIIIGGRCNATTPSRNVVNDILAYDPKSDAWRVLGTMPLSVMAPSAGIVDGKIVVTSGGLNNPQPLTADTNIASLPAGE